jgi:hypothetical protein
LNLPALAYIGDVPVESSYHGSALLFRLLQGYPPDLLAIVETSMHDSQAARRLPGVTYVKLDVGSRRPLDTRWHRWVNAWYTLRGASRERGVAPLLRPFTPLAVLSVAHGYGWLAASRFAERRNLALHLVVHDDWPRQTDLPTRAREWLDRRFGQVYRQATSRLCVSPYMEETYRKRYGVEGSVLLPSRAADGPRFDSPPPRLRSGGRELVIGFGGTINTRGYTEALRQLASSLARVGGKLNIYGPISADQCARAGLDAPNVRVQGLVPAADFIARMREEVDALFLPMSFDPADLENMRLSFPSKLTDYTAAGLPILAYGPAQGSGIRWARENPGVALVVDSPGQADLDNAVKALLSPDKRWALATKAMEIGDKHFSHAAASAVFLDRLSR